MTDILEELQWRGLIAQHSDINELRKALNEGSISFYCGFDPTAASLHHGHLVAVKMMRHLQMAGHRPIVLVGGATGLIGDPRPKGERSLNTRETVAEWTQALRSQLESLLDFEGPNAAITVNNLDWTKELSAIDFLRDLGKHFRMGTMLSKDIVARRLQSDEGISFTEFSYQILQANDYLELYRRYNCTLELGGNDQWGNIVGGMDLVRKVEGASVHVLTNQLITKSDGTKFGKTEGGAVWLNPQMLSPYKFYQFWLNTADADVIRMLKVFTFLSKERIEELEVELAERAYAREAQRVLADEVTTWVHGAQATARVKDASAVLFGKKDPVDVDGETLRDAVAELPLVNASLGTSLQDVLVDLGFEKGRGAARRTIAAGGVSINNVKVDDEERVLNAEDILAGELILVRKGRKNMAAIRVG
ncbi:tyrosine--tRNA ligase [Arcanobacterium buesumense]|uniref:Tyrosine--tRNA ligase n=1 Tax=Arcanobacterium buesumense TaxID=2722751 RepID=A0A6H2ELF5_9ACTO|nr:tyrosine--tRNA ligase [Arcanobacterium buesumense]QJC21857.1 tyrosine--tRNA ligase [Arcanobacterium buesumense]